MNPEGIFLKIVIIMTCLDNSECFKAVWGVYSEDQQDPIFYNGNIPLVYEFQYLDEKFTRNKIIPIFTCASTSKLASCIIENDESTIVKSNFSPDFEPYSSSLFEQIWQKSEGVHEKRKFCDQIQNNLPSHMSNDAWNQYLNQLRNCALGRLMGSKIYTMYFNFTLMNQPFTEISRRYHQEIFPELEKLKYANAFETLVTYFVFNGNFNLGLQGIILHTYYARRNRIIQALSECRQGRIPVSIINITNFEENLRDLKLRLLLHRINSEKYFEISIDFVHFISKFYSLSLVDCSQTERSLVIKISIPIKEIIKSKLVLQKIYPIPFTYDGKICQLKLITPEDQNYLIFEENVHKSNCVPNSLCHIANLGPIDDCLTSINSKSYKNLKPFCKFQCTRQIFGPLNWPIVNQISSDLFIISGYGYFKIICSTEESHFERKTVEMKRDFVGAHKIKLPCTCSIEVYPENHQISTGLQPQVYKSTSAQGCQKDWHSLEIKEIVPAHFLHESYFANVTIHSDTDHIGDYFSSELANYYTEDRDYDQLLQNCQKISNSNGNAVLALTITLLLVFLIFGGIVGWIIWEMKVFRNGFEYLRNQHQQKLYREISKKEAETEFISLN